MPQMSPLSWMLLMFYFLMIYTLINMTNYAFFSYSLITVLKKIKTSINWKW
uniref:ATP synthase F0 subunit 8 n=1 Tax=Bostrichoidea sp. 1 KM-2017 TaxID=2219275 RepID=A0A346RJM4_9COLE|nr:ATP synthase F0 subunit 8 [Bostrichoidea sp. 1 KM-2017]